MKKIILSIALATSLMFSLAAQAEEKEAPMVIPDTPAAIHQMVNAAMDEMTAMIAAGSMKDLHQRAFAVRDLVAALPEKSAALPEEKLTAVKSNVKFVATLAERLDAAGDSNDKAAAEENFNKMKGVLDALWTNYPDTVQ